MRDPGESVFHRGVRGEALVTRIVTAGERLVELTDTERLILDAAKRFGVSAPPTNGGGELGVRRQLTDLLLEQRLLTPEQLELVLDEAFTQLRTRSDQA